MSVIKPIIKWAGGKTQILDKVLDEFPLEINNYHEIFLGGGSVLLGFLYKVNNNLIKIKGNIYAYDSNEPLIYVYKNIQTNYLELYDEIVKFIITYTSCESKEDYYYLIRKSYNNLTIEDKRTLIGSAMFIFLNKTCFRGLFRVGPNGFNVPYGNYKNPEIINKEHLKNIHDLIQNVIFKCCDFRESINDINKGDFIYCDPPYFPENSKSFVSYTKDGFGLPNHNKLFNLLKENDLNFLMSNSNTDFVNESFSKTIYNIKYISAKRSINSKNPDAKTTEVLIKNYV